MGESLQCLTVDNTYRQKEGAGGKAGTVHMLNCELGLMGEGGAHVGDVG